MIVKPERTQNNITTNPALGMNSKEDDKDREAKQSSTTPDPGDHIGK